MATKILNFWRLYQYSGHRILRSWRGSALIVFGVPPLGGPEPRKRGTPNVEDLILRRDPSWGSLDNWKNRWHREIVTLTLDLSELRDANEKALAQLSRTSEEEFDSELREIENFLLSIYRFAVLAVRGQQEIERAADVWRETLEVIDRAARQVQELSARLPGVHPSLDRILEIRHAASDMLALYA
jgi:hypothetical protein